MALALRGAYAGGSSWPGVARSLSPAERHERGQDYFDIHLISQPFHL